jgi:hypothetical protein
VILPQPALHVRVIAGSQPAMLGRLASVLQCKKPVPGCDGGSLISQIAAYGGIAVCMDVTVILLGFTR